MKRLGLNEVWRETARRTGAQAPILLTLVAAFVLLPTLAAYQLVPELTPDAKLLMTRARMERIGPMILVLGLFQLFGQLSVIAVATDGGRSTVGGALRRAFIALPRVIVAVLALFAAAFLVVFVVSIVVGIAVTVVSPGMVADKRLAATIAVLILIPLAWAAIRASLFMPIAVAEEAGPIDSIRLSWASTRGYAAAIAMQFLFAAIGLVALQGLVGLVTGGTARAIDAMLGGHFAQFVALVIAGIVGTLANLFLTMLALTIYRRLRPAFTPRTGGERG